MDLKVPPSPRLRRREPVAPDGSAVVGTGRRGAARTTTPEEDGDV
jgi:NADH-quinone oxidoreductase subunit H